MDLLHITPPNSLSCLLPLLEISSAVRFRLRSLALRPPQYCTYSTTLHFPRLVPYPPYSRFRPCLFVTLLSSIWAENIPRRTTTEQRRRMAWVLGAHEEKDRVQYMMDEPGDRYKENRREALDQWIK
jgi:hypothetical protein